MCLSSPTDASATNTKTKPHCDAVDCNGNNTTMSNSITHSKSNSISTVPDENDGDLGFKEENAIYKEIISGTYSNNTSTTKANEFTSRIRWPDLLAQTFLHVGSIYAIYLMLFAKFYTLFWLVILVWGSGFGITAGAHRLWSHKSYTASLPLRLILVFLFTIAGQRDAYTWALDHRIHHKFSETEADPHNVKRGFFFAHVGWLFLTAHPKVEEKRKVIDMSDLESDVIVMWQRKYFIPLFALITIGFPVFVPVYFWQEDLWLSFWISFVLRFTWTLNLAFLVNSVAHMWGSKPYDKNIRSVESPMVAFLALGEGWHNYHHVFPWDYKTGEFGAVILNPTTTILDFCAKLGLVSERKSVSKGMILRRAKKCGDGTRFLSDEYVHENQVWGFGDRDIDKEDHQELLEMRD